ncbi:hypothetical protein Poli38472_005438 [Pythium oligandrum]|uniref:DOMON domain-containing protein n=1 Tax=Pythium oligandrum TaxID=41045 RepID=A0A8K1FGJ0_PYTOL|nr:hypothetical protein Poli38472_005438 [Pythium oligandrum]|eukprot:TMW62820.1 hypothetical protein Poli38472_005438 [Pythium oligandrum]
MVRRFLTSTSALLAVAAAAIATPEICQSSAFKALTATPLGSSPLLVRSLVKGDQVCLEFTLSSSAPSDTEWFAVGLAATASMVNTPESNVMIYQKSVDVPESHVIGGYSSAEVVKESDQTFFAVHEASTAPLKFSYQRTLAASSKNDVVIDPTKEAQFIWAYGSSWPIRGHKSGTRGTEKYNFVSGASASADDDDDNFCKDNNCTAIVGGVAFLAMLVGGFVVTSLLRTTSVGHVLLHKTLATPPVKSTTNAPLASPWTMFVQNLADLRIGELLVMIVFLIAVVALAGLSSSKTGISKSGQTALLIMMFMLLPIAKIPLWTATFGSSFERIVKFHRWLGMLLSLITLIHLILAVDVVKPVSSEQYGEVIPLWGLLAFITFVAIGFTANEFMRRMFFDVFYLSHRVLSIIGFVFTILHAPKKIGPALLVPLVFYVLGLVNQWIKSYTTTYEASVSVHESTGTTTLILDSTDKTKQFAQKMNLCSYFWVKISTVSGIEWHPFSAIVTPNGDSIAFCMRAMGPNTKSFTAKMLEHGKSTYTLGVNLCGPFGRISVDVDQYDVIVLIGGGVGVTPLLSAINQRRLFAPKGSKALDWNILWSVRYTDDLLMTDKLMPSRDQLEYSASNGNVQQDAYEPLTDAGAASGLKVTWHCHCSEEKQDGYVTRANGDHLAYRAGIPVLDEYINSSRYMGRKVAVLACGPPTMTVEAQALAQKCGFDFHKEVFNW